MKFELEIVSRRYGRFIVVAPARFADEILSIKWRIVKCMGRAAGREFEAVGYRRLAKWKYQNTLRMHRFIWELAKNPPTPTIDHVDGNPLNNAEDNLRAATHAENQRNMQRRRDNTSGVPGVAWHKLRGKWIAYTSCQGRMRNLGYFTTIEDASRARRDAALREYGRFSPLSREQANA